MLASRAVNAAWEFMSHENWDFWGEIEGRFEMGLALKEFVGGCLKESEGLMTLDLEGWEPQKIRGVWGFFFLLL